METSSRMESAWTQRVVIIAIVGLLLVVAAYVWGNRLSATVEPSLSQASAYESLRGVAGARQLDTDQARDAAAVSSTYAGFRGVAAARAADAASGSSFAGSPQFSGLEGVAAVRALDAAPGH
jgi:hypothetical protein